MRPASEQSETDWSEVERKISDFAKKYSLLGIMVLGLLLSFSFGSQFLGILGGIAAMGAYVAYPKEVEHWLEKNQPMIAGAAFGFFYAGPVGLLLGAWLGQFLHTKYEQITNAANQVANAVKPVIATGNWIKEKSGSLYQNTLSGLKIAGQAIIGTGAPEEEEIAEPEINFTELVSSGRNLLAKGTDFVTTQLSNLANYLPTLEEDTQPKEPASAANINDQAVLSPAPVYLASEGPGAVAQPIPASEAHAQPQRRKRKGFMSDWPMTIM